ncbi:DsbA family protein [Nonomuraea turcica]|uniref:DsbA family protein n=1 Tax=Nonomuraea sp. G32 TaxID=3067274 RepID=UPI00273AB460|nr:DsbA family protein [Nonomuraea sp. G32]MDP4510957.1 DsbA family protein [Nonomuraea sp. G32]
MRVEIWSEIACPWCGLGSHRLDRAVERFEHGAEVEVIHRSFPLSDGFTVGSTISVREVLLRRYGLAGARLEASTRQIEATHPTVLVADNDAAICGPDGCAVPADHVAHA